jgi:hypothetical protein
MVDKNKPDLTKSLKDLQAIADWFETRDEIDVEEGLSKVKEAAKLIKVSKARLVEIENEFQEIEKEIADDIEDEEPAPGQSHNQIDDDEPVNLNDIPF